MVARTITISITPDAAHPADMESQSTGVGGGGNMEKAYGKEKAKELQMKYRSTVRWRMREIIKKSSPQLP